MSSRLIRSFSHALRGIRVAWREEVNMRIHVSVAIIVLLIGLWYGFNAMEWALIIHVCAFVISLEFVNSGIERLADASQPRVSPLIQTMKDMFAASVFIASLAAVLVGTVIIGPRVIGIFFP